MSTTESSFNWPLSEIPLLTTPSRHCHLRCHTNSAPGFGLTLSVPFHRPICTTFETCHHPEECEHPDGRFPNFLIVLAVNCVQHTKTCRIWPTVCSNCRTCWNHHWLPISSTLTIASTITINVDLTTMALSRMFFRVRCRDYQACYTIYTRRQELMNSPSGQTNSSTWEEIFRLGQDDLDTTQGLRTATIGDC